MDVFDLTAKIALDTSEYEDGLGKAKKSSDGFVGTMKKLAKVVAGSAVVKGLADITRSGLDAYASFEQLSGGAKKIFNEMDISKIALDAKEAYKDLGMSANEYLAVINDVGASFSATMGDERGYLAAKTGLQAISDYASGTGKSVNELSQKFTLITKSTASYQSIADQFSGILPATTGEFLNQAQAAGFLKGSYESLTDVPIAEYQAAVSQMLQKGTEALGLAGNTALEASTTISGAAQTAKAAWENFLVAVADPTQDLDAATGALADSVIALADNAVPRVLSIVPRMADAFAESSAAVDALVTGLELAGVAMASDFAGNKIMQIINGFQNARVQIALFTAANGEAALTSAALTGKLTVAETVVGVLTGKISLATAAQHGLNAAMNANPIGILIGLAATLGFALKNSVDEAEEVANEIAGIPETAEEASQKMEEIKARMDEIAKLQGEEWTAERSNEYLNLMNALDVLKVKYDELFAAEQQAAEEAGKFSMKVGSATIELSTGSEEAKKVAENFCTDVANMLQAYEDLYSGILGNVQGWFGPFEQASVSVQTSVADMMAAMASQADFNNAYSDNLRYLAQNGLGEMATAFRELGPEGAAYAQTMVDSITKAGGAASEGGQEIIRNFQDMFSKLGDSETELAQVMTDMGGDFDQVMQDIADAYASGVAGFDQSEKAREAGVATINSLAGGLDSGKGELSRVLDEMVAMINARLGSAGGKFGFGGSGGFVRGFSTGLDYVPYDEFPAYLHRGEAVLTAPEARAWRNGEGKAPSGAGPIVINQYIQSVPQTPAEFGAATEAYFEQARWLL